MIDEEVESVLREIRERVISQAVADQLPQNGDSNAQRVVSPVPTVRNAEALARLNAHLTTTGRAWDRLPPVFSNRHGTAARIELWIKARLKVFSRWFTWEQVNFNAAAHHALGDAAEVLAHHESALTSVSTQLGELQALRDELVSQRAVIEAQGTDIASLRAQLQEERLDLQTHQRDTSTLRGELEAVRIQAEVQLEAARSESAAEQASLAAELRERSDRIESEQRVCYKQLSLESSETVSSQERAQRQASASLAELKQRIEQLEGSAKRSKP